MWNENNAVLVVHGDYESLKRHKNAVNFPTPLRPQLLTIWPGCHEKLSTKGPLLLHPWLSLPSLAELSICPIPQFYLNVMIKETNKNDIFPMFVCEWKLPWGIIGQHGHLFQPQEKAVSAGPPELHRRDWGGLAGQGSHGRVGGAKEYLLQY